MKRLLLNPFFIFWAYYFFGPFLTVPQILQAANADSLFTADLLYLKLIYHSIAYLSILPFILYISLYLKLDGHVKPRLQLIGGIRPVFIILAAIFILSLFYFLYSNAILLFGRDIFRARAYLEYVEANHIITLLVLILISAYIFLDKKYILILGVFVILFDVLMSRRQLMIFFIYPLMRRISFRHILYIFIFFSAFSILRHRQNITFDVSSLYAPFFGESYMVFLSSVNYDGCPAKVNSFYDYFNFERNFLDCRQVSSGAGGFSARFYYNIFFGLLSVGVFTIVNIFILYFLSKYINSRLHTLLGIILFVSLFIIFRDSLLNSQLFFIKYFFVMLMASILISGLKQLSVISEQSSRNRLNPESDTTHKNRFLERP